MGTTDLATQLYGDLMTLVVPLALTKKEVL